MASIAFRPATVQDRPLILDSFLKSYSACSQHARGVHPNILINKLEPLIVLWETVVAHPVDDPSEILGWACVDRASRTIAWIYVKSSYRKHGIARAILKHLQIGSGEVSTPFIPTKSPAGTNFGRWADSHGHVVRHRPWLPEQVLAESLAASMVDEFVPDGSKTN